MASGDRSGGEADRLAHFLIAVGELCATAALAELRVRATTVEGRQVEGVPEFPRWTTDGDELDDTGFACELDTPETR